jgi:hypothetical protein
MPVLTKFPSFKFPQPYHFIIFSDFFTDATIIVKFINDGY